MNIHSAISQAAKILKSKLISSAFIDSEILMAEVLNEDRTYILLNSQKKINPDLLNIYNKLVSMRASRKPIAYLTNKKYFWNSQFYVSPETLVPRPDSEIIVENILRLTKHKNKLKILDIGIGSGCILLSVLKEKVNFYGTGIDISKNCLKISKINAINLKVDSRLKLFKSNVDKFRIGKYDLILSNPPYINSCRLKYLDKDIINFEPRSALDGGLDGLSEIRKVIKKSSELIKRNGKFVLEIGFDQKNKVINLLKKEGFYINSIHKDYANNDRCIISTKK